MSGQSYARRAVLRGAAGAGAIGLVAAAGAGTVAAASASAATAAPEQEHAPVTSDTPVVVYLRDASSGELEIFAGTSRTQVHDPALAARLARAIQ
jgi:nitrous oxide reductase